MLSSCAVSTEDDSNTRVSVQAVGQGPVDGKFYLGSRVFFGPKKNRNYFYLDPNHGVIFLGQRRVSLSTGSQWFVASSWLPKPVQSVTRVLET